MKVLIYTHAFAPLVGGVETVVMSLAEGLARLRAKELGDSLEVTVATPTPARGMDDAVLPFRVVRQPGPGRLVRLLRRADIVHLAGPALLPLCLGLLMRKRIVVEHHGFQAACPNGQLFYEPNQSPCPGHYMAERHLECLRCNAKCGWIASIKMWLLTFPRRRLCEMISANVAPTAWLSTVLHLPRTIVIPHGLHLPARYQASDNFASPATFVFLGRLVGTKGAGILLAASKKLRKQGYTFRVKIIGDGADREKLETEVAASGLADCVEFLGCLTDEGIDETVARAVAVVMPSLAGEVFGLAAAENMLRGRMVIASDIGALREVVGDTGLLFMPGDVADLARCMQGVLEDLRRAADLGRKASQRAIQLFTELQMAQNHFALYQGLNPCAE